MQIIIIVNITYNKTTTYNGLIIGKLTLTRRSRNQKDLRAHPERSEIRSY